MKARSLISAISAAIVAASLTIAGAASAAVPQSLTHQGRLYDEKGVPVAESTKMKFAIYDAGGTELWTETHTVLFDDGYYSVELGSQQPFSSDLWGKPSLELGITIGDDPEMTPRAAIRSVPYALVSGDAVGDIHPTTVSIGGTTVIDAQGKWVGDPTGLLGPAGPVGPAGPIGPTGATGPEGAMGPAGPIGPTGPVGATGAMGPQGPVGATGAQGVMGPQGVMGLQGPAGVAGVMGPQGPVGATGALGPQGPAGATGATGPQGTAGATGATGVVTSFGFDGNWTQTLTGNVWVAPTVCRTGTYTPTTANEVAIITLSTTAQAPAAGSNVLLVNAAVAINGSSTFTELASNRHADQLNVGMASVSNTQRYSLTQGTSYVFGTILTTSASVSLTGASCTGTVLILRN